jgi:hypothetical protein
VVHTVKTETVAAIMERAKNFPDVRMLERKEMEYPDRSNLPQNPFAKPFSVFPVSNGVIQKQQNTSSMQSAQTPGTSFNGVTGPTETGAFPPDDMGAIGPTQYIVFGNGRLRSFNKTTGVADGVLNINPDVFFASVLTPVGGSVTQVFTSDPRIRYDRYSGKWILVIIDVALDAMGNTPVANRVLLAFSNTSTITGATTWTFSQFTGEAGKFTDYETLGIDKNALYIGTNMFTLAGAFSSTNGYVINRTSFLAGGAYTVTSFLGLVATPGGAGLFTPQGVDNFDVAPTEGYFIGVDNASFGKLMMRRVSTPGGVPTISSNISITVNSTSFPATVPHLGNTGGTNGKLDGLDDRLFAAMARGGHLWTAHNIGVAETGVATSNASLLRNAVRWYDITTLTGTPIITQSGTIFDPLVTASNPRWHSIPSVMISGQGHAAFSMTTAGINDRSNSATAGRLSGDVLGTTQAAILTTGSATAYNPPGDPGGSGGRRWGDYSYVSLDPVDDMTMWMINQYCVGTNTYGCNVTKLLAPPPATASGCSPSSTVAGQTSVNIIVTGTSVSGSGFYDPGANLAAPALPFSHISVTVSGGVTVNSVTYTDPTHITLNISTVGASAGAKTITVTNPDGQSLVSASAILTITPPLPVLFSSFIANKIKNTAVLNWSTAQEQNNRGFEIQRSADGNFADSNSVIIGFVNGNGTTTAASKYQYTDRLPLYGKNFYRLKQIDFDSKYAWSEIRRVDFVNDVEPVVYPNPFSGIILVTNIADKTDYQILNAQGQVVMQGKLNNNKINASKLAKGSYILQLIVGDGEKMIKLIKK